jgi:phosphoribosylformylglycinamidine cyclo-ligase
MGNTYKDSGVDYDPMDEFKRKAQEEASLTSINSKYGLRVVEGSRGESAFLMEGPDFYLGHVEEGLGTKNLVADKMYLLTGKSYYDQIAQDTVAMIVNDLITLGVMPLSVAMHLAAGSSDWFNDEIRRQDLIFGWSKACWLARCVWGGGETPTLKGIINPETVVLAGSAIGVVSSKERFGSEMQLF